MKFFILIIFFIYSNAKAQVSNPADPVSPLHPSNSSGGGITSMGPWIDGLIEKNMLLEHLTEKLDGFDLYINKVEVSDYKDTDCESNYVKLGLKDCNPEFILEVIVCDSKDNCVARKGFWQGYMKPKRTRVFRFNQEDLYVCKNKDPELSFKDVNDFRNMVARVVDASVDKNYYMGFQLVEYNSFLSNRVIGKKVWGLKYFKRKLLDGEFNFVIIDDSKKVKVHGKVKIPGIL